MNYKERIGELEVYITSLVNASSDSLDSYSRAFSVRVEEEKIKIIFNSPTAFLLDEKLYFALRKTIQVPLYPILTLKYTNSMIVEENKSNNIADMRAFSYPFSWGVPKRLIYQNFNDISFTNNEINLMTDLSIKIKNITSIMLSGGSGSGKSYLINLLLNYFKNFTDKEKIYIVDGKRDLPAIFARENNIKNITTNSLDTPDQTLNKLCDLLSEINKKIDDRQEKLFNGNIKEEELKPIFVVIDEVGALVSMSSKQIKDKFNSLLTRISILGRQSKVIILLASQRLDANTLPTIIREQANILIQLGHLNKNNLQYLFPDLNQESIFIPHDEEKRGIGIIQVNGELHTLLVPSIREE